MAALVCASLSLQGCALWRSQSQPEVPDAKDGAQTTTATKLQKFLWVFSPYRPDIQQGNFVSQEMLTQLQVGQTREQVRFILGTPLLTDIFHADRWDYPFRLARGSGETTSSRVVVFFDKEGKVVSMNARGAELDRLLEQQLGPIPEVKDAKDEEKK